MLWLLPTQPSQNDSRRLGTPPDSLESGISPAQELGRRAKAAKYYPENQGFDINIGGCIYGGPPTFFDPYRIHNLTNRKTGEYLPDRLADEVCQFIDRSDVQPFFACLWNYSVHWPMEAPAKLLRKYENRNGPGLNDTRYGAMIEALDTSFGKIMNHLDNRGLTDNTLVIFTSDNGDLPGCLTTDRYASPKATYTKVGFVYH